MAQEGREVLLVGSRVNRVRRQGSPRKLCLEISNNRSLGGRHLR